MQEGFIGLIRAAKQFDPKLGYKFSTYATVSIRRQIARSTISKCLIRMPATLNITRGLNYSFYRFTQKLRKEEDAFNKERGYWPTLEDIIDVLHLNHENVPRIEKLILASNSDNYKTIGEAENLGDREVLYWDEDRKERKGLRKELEIVLNTLTDREREIVKLSYGLKDGNEYTFEEIGKIFKISRERVRQIAGKAISRLQHTSRSKYLEEFL